MKNFICLILSVILAISVSGCNSSETAQKEAVAKKEHETKKEYKANEDHDYTLTKGINLSELEGITFGKTFLDEEETYIGIRQKGFDHVRIPIDFRNYCNDNGVISDSFYERLDNIIEMANSNELIAILDFHGWYDFNVSKGDDVLFKKIWKSLALHYKNRLADSLFFELINEPHVTEGGDLDAENLWNLQNSVIGEIREIDPLRTIVVAMHEWNGPWTLQNFKEYDYDNLIVAIHIYEPLDFTHQGMAWAGKSDVKLELTEEMLDGLTRQLDMITEFKDSTGHKVMLNEFGLNTTGYISDKDVSDYLSHIAEYTKNHDIPWTYWEYNKSFGLLSSGFLGFGKEWRQNALDALMKNEILY